VFRFSSKLLGAEKTNVDGMWYPRFERELCQWVGPGTETRLLATMRVSDTDTTHVICVGVHGAGEHAVCGSVYARVGAWDSFSRNPR
jgi:hypothetical protein